MLTEKAQVKRLERYMRLAGFEVNRFLLRSCCHNHALAIWQEWQVAQAMYNSKPERSTESAGQFVEFVGELTAACAGLADSVTLTLAGQPTVNGGLIDEIVARVGTDPNAIMHDFIRKPMNPPETKTKKKVQPTWIINVKGVQ